MVEPHKKSVEADGRPQPAARSLTKALMRVWARGRGRRLGHHLLVAFRQSRYTHPKQMAAKRETPPLPGLGSWGQIRLWACALVAAILVCASTTTAHARILATAPAAENSPLGFAGNSAPARALASRLQAPESPLESAFGYGQIVVDNAYATRGGANIVYRGLAAGEDAAAGLVARAPGAGNSIASHVAGARASQWISTTRSLDVAMSRFGQNGVVGIDLSKVGTQVVDLTRGIPGIGQNTMLSRWAINAQEVVIQGSVPVGAIIPLP